MKKQTPAQLKKKCDQLFSLYIRRKYSKSGMVKCYTCDSEHPVSEIQCGHFVRRVHLSTRWDEHNCRPQCFSCNVWKRGNYSEFAVRLQREDPNILEELAQKKNRTCQMKKGDYENLIESLKANLDAMP
jgi:hypothetical protein